MHPGRNSAGDPTTIATAFARDVATPPGVLEFVTELFRELAQELRQSALVQLVGREANHGAIEASAWIHDRNAVEAKEDECRRQTGALVAIHKRLVLGDMEGVGGAHLEEAHVHKFSPKRLEGHSYRGFQR